MNLKRFVTFVHHWSCSYIKYVLDAAIKGKGNLVRWKGNLVRCLCKRKKMWMCARTTFYTQTPSFTNAWPWVKSTVYCSG